MSSVSSSSYTKIEDSIYTAFTALSVGSGYFLDQNGPEPASPYCNIFVITTTPLGEAQESTIVKFSDRTTYLSQTYEIVVRFAFVGKDKQNSGSDTNAANNADDFAQKLRSVKYRQLFADNGLSILRISPLRRTQQKRETDIYSVYTVDVTMAYDKHTQLTFDTIDHGEINGTLTEAGNTTVTTTFTF